MTLETHIYRGNATTLLRDIKTACREELKNKDAWDWMPERPEFYAQERAQFIRCFPAIRNGTVPPEYFESYHDLVCDQGTSFAALILTRGLKTRRAS